MYKVFINQKTIYLTKDISNLHLEVEDILAYPHSIAELKLELEKFKTNPYALNLYIINPNDPEQLWHDFLSMFVMIEAAGGLVTNASGQLLFIYRFGKWDLPKGKIELNEHMDKAALREVEEETAIGNLTIIHPLIQTMHIFDERGKPCIKHTWWYHMKTNGMNVPIPQKEEGITHAQWIGRDGLHEVMQNTYPSIIEVLQSFDQKEEQTLTQQE